MKATIATLVLCIYMVLNTQTVYAQLFPNSSFDDKFRQIEELIPTPNDQRTASGAPGKDYWQQRADYSMKITIDDATQKLYGNETITYYNQSPDALTYLWLQLDQNMFEKTSDRAAVEQQKLKPEMSADDIARFSPQYEGGFHIEQVKDAKGGNLPYFINKTMMRIELPTALLPGQKVGFSIKWWYLINDRMKVGGRSGYEYFETDKNYLYTMAQFYPRMAAYYDVYGWQHKQFLGAGEFTLDFGNYDVELTVPANHTVGATGTLQNATNVLTPEQIKRWELAKLDTSKPTIIVTQAEAEANEKITTAQTKTWRFQAENVRDFAFSTSKKFIWDAMAVKQTTKTVMAMSLYPKEGNPLWEQYSTRAVAHTLKWYSHYTFDYPYPVAYSVHANDIGMEYPMMCFNYGRPEPDGTYSARLKYGMISVIIHEVGHNYFPMIVNSDERQWTWMDEGLNSFLQYLAEQQFESDYPSRRGPARNITEYMKGDPNRLEPIMTNSESIRQFGNNAYGKAATGCNILRETILGRENFDYAFKEYCRRWMFKRPTPADFFRSMEDASGTDLDWFWRGWFYSTDYVDISISDVKWKQISTKNPDIEKALAKDAREKANMDITEIANQTAIDKTYEEQDSALIDFYSTFDELNVRESERKEYQKYLESLTPTERKLIQDNTQHFYEVSFNRVGGMVMPIIVRLTLEDGQQIVKRIPAEIWRKGDTTVTKVFVTNSPVALFELDPYLETADINLDNNYFPKRFEPSRFELFRQNNQPQPNPNPMQRGQNGRGTGQ
jgi:Peptidase family M1 domain